MKSNMMQRQKHVQKLIKNNFLENLFRFLQEGANVLPIIPCSAAQSKDEQIYSSELQTYFFFALFVAAHLDFCCFLMLYHKLEEV